MLPVFRSLPVAREVYRPGTLPARARTYASDTITLGWEDRQRARGRRRSDGGVEFGTALDRGTTLRGGDTFVLDTLSVAIAVVERPEPVCVIAPASAVEWALYAYHIGNGHQPLMIAAGALVCPDAAGVAELLDYHGIPFSRALQPFTPVGAAVSAHVHRP
jgi:urease accessory protein